MPALVAADRPRRPDVVRTRRQGVVRTLAVDLADRVDRRQVDHVEAHVGDGGQSLLRVGERAVRRDAADDRTLGTREELVPGAVEGPGSVDPHLVARGPGDQFADRVLVQVRLHVCGERRGDAGGQLQRGVPQRGRGRGDDVGVLGIGDGGDLVEQPGALLEVVGELLRALAGGDLDLDGVMPRGQRIAPGLHAERPEALAVGDDGGQPAVGLLAELRHAHQGGGRGDGALGRFPHDIGCHGVVALAEHGGGDRQVLAHDGAGREGAAGHDGGDIGDAEAEVRTASHRDHAIEVAGGQHIGAGRSTAARRDGRDRGTLGGHGAPESRCSVWERGIARCG